MSQNGRIGLITPVPEANNTNNGALNWFNLRGPVIPPVATPQPANLAGSDAMKLADAEIASINASTREVRMNRDEYLRKHNPQGFWQARQNAIDEELKQANDIARRSNDAVPQPLTDIMLRAEALAQAEAKAKEVAERFAEARKETEAALKAENEERARMIAETEAKAKEQAEADAKAFVQAQEEKIVACYIAPNHRTHKTAWKQTVFDKLNVQDEKVNWITASNVGKTNFAKYHSGNAITIRRVQDFWWYLNNVGRGTNDTFEGKAIIIDLAEMKGMDYSLLKQIKDGFVSDEKHGVRMFESPNIWVLSNCHPDTTSYITTWTVVGDELVAM